MAGHWETNCPEWWAKRIKFIEDIVSDDQEELAAIYQGALSYLQPSIYEGFGLPILEAMQCRTPVICGKNSSLPEIAGQRALFVEAEEAENFAAAVKQVLAWQKKERQAFVDKAQGQKFSWEKPLQPKKFIKNLFNKHASSLEKNFINRAGLAFIVALIGAVAPVFAYQGSFSTPSVLQNYQLPAWVNRWASFDGVHYLALLSKVIKIV